MKQAKNVKKWLFGFLVAVSLGGFVVLYSYLSWESVQMPLLRFSAPDEQANYYFSKIFAEKSVLSYPEPLLEVSQDFVHTRSMTASNGEVKPVGFLGFSLIYGMLGKIFGVALIPFFTPVLSVLSTIFFYAAIRRIFNKKIAFISCALLLIHPAYWYYSTRALMPNVLFLDLLIIGLSILIIASPPSRTPKYISTIIYLKGITGATTIKKKFVTRIWALWWKAKYVLRKVFCLKIVLFALGGFFIALSLTVRLSEVLWVSVLLFVWGFMYIRRLTLWRVIFFIGGFAIPVSVLLFYNYSLYGNILSSGYKMMNTALSNDALTRTVGLVQQGHFKGLIVSVKDVIRPYLPLLLPFGYRPDIFWGNAINYLVTFFWWFTIPTIAGTALLLRNQVIHIVRHRVPHQLWYLLMWCLVTGWLVVFYGSWKLTDNINGHVALGVSYVRYWLPSYVMALPFLATLFVWLFEKGRNSLFRWWCIILLMGAMTVMSLNTVFLGGQESLLDAKNQLSEMQEKAHKVFEYTPNDAVIFSQRSDKIFFPERRVAGSFAEFPERNLIITLITKAPVYYYGLWDKETAKYICGKYFEPLGIRWEYVDRIADREYLYHLTVIPK